MPRRFERSAGVLRVREVAASYVTLPSPSSSVGEPAAAAAVFSQHFDTVVQAQELMMAMYVDSRIRCLAVEAVYRGTVNSATVGCRDMLRSALLLNAAGVILAHLHPSGDSSASAEDLTFTRRMIEAARIMGVEVHDHLILGFDTAGAVRFTSLRQRGLM
jgi:DNA repair protein RadC